MGFDEIKRGPEIRKPDTIVVAKGARLAFSLLVQLRGVSRCRMRLSRTSSGAGDEGVMRA